MPIKSVKITKSNRKDKKLKAVFKDIYGKEKTVHFGAKGYEDYTIHKDEERKDRYLKRHKVNQDWNDFTTPGSLSRWILWNKPSIKESIKDFKERFNLK